MYIQLKDVTGEIYHVSPHYIAYLKEGKPTGTSSEVFKVVLNCGKQIILTKGEFGNIKHQVDQNGLK